MSDSCGEKASLVENGLFMHPSGLKYTFVCTDKKQGHVTNLTWASNARGSGPIQDNEIFTLAILDYMYNYFVIAGGSASVLIKEADAFTSVVCERYISTLKDQLVCPEIEGRTTIQSQYGM
jgi:hypothetical protein